MIALTLLALGCISSQEEPPNEETATETSTPQEETGLAPRTLFENPKEAVDLDPDPAVVRVELSASAYSYTVGDEIIEGWAYNQQVPGPTIRVPEGARLEVELKNKIESPTTIHWHGLHVPWDMDGVVWMGAPIEPETEFTYSFTLNQAAGTFWYHPHYDTQRQVDLGMYGVVVIENPDEPTVDRELIAVLDSHQEYETDDIDGVHHGLEGINTQWTVNSQTQPLVEAAVGEQIRLRLINASNTGYAHLEIPGARKIAGDQGLLATAESGESLLLAPGDRVDVDLTVESDVTILTRPYSHNGGEAFGEETVLFEIEALEGQSTPASPEALNWPFSQQPSSTDPGRTDIRWTLTGDPCTGAWEMNGETFPDVSIPELDLNADAILEIRNMSSTEHPFHLHGHPFEVLSIDEVETPWAVLEDTINIPIRGTARLRLLANNPGDWMAHCHILTHPDGGMMTVLRVNAMDE